MPSLSKMKPAFFTGHYISVFLSLVRNELAGSFSVRVHKRFRKATRSPIAYPMNLKIKNATKVSLHQTEKRACECTSKQFFLQ